MTRRAGVRRSMDGMSLVEATVAMGLLGMVLVGVLPAFVEHSAVNTKNEIRSGAVAAAQVTMEGLRLVDPAAMPTGGSSPPQTVQVGSWTYEVTTRYCTVPAFCDSGSRHLLVEVRYGNELLYSVENVYTQLR